RVPRAACRRPSLALPAEVDVVLLPVGLFLGFHQDERPQPSGPACPEHRSPPGPARPSPAGRAGAATGHEVTASSGIATGSFACSTPSAGSLLLTCPSPRGWTAWTWSAAKPSWVNLATTCSPPPPPPPKSLPMAPVTASSTPPEDPSPASAAAAARWSAPGTAALTLA